jgi:peptide/nickel transport system substrate-binding protein
MGFRSMAVRLLALAACVLLAGCANSATSSKGSSTLTIAVDAFDATLLPIGNATTQGSRVDFMIFERLVENDFDGEPQPILADSVTPEEDGKVWTVVLREGVNFSDGEPLTSEDVIYSFEFALDEANGFLQRGRIGVIEDMEAVDERTVKFTLSSPLSSFQDALTLVGIAPKHAMEPDPKAFAIKPIGTGPFVLTRFTPNDRVVMAANENYWGGKPSIDELVFLSVPDATTRLSDLAAGKVDIIAPLLGTQIEELESHDGLSVAETDSTQRVDLWINNTVKPFNDKLVRQALSYAIDRQAMVESLAPSSRPAVGPITPSSWGFDDSIEGLPYDPERAKQLLAKAGYPDGLEFTLLVSTRAGEEREAALIQQQAAAAGIKVKVDTMDYAALIERVVVKKEYVAARLTATQTPDPDSMTFIYFHSESPGNYWGYKNPEIDKLLEQGRSTVERDDRIPIYSELTERLLDEAPNIWMYYNKVLFGVGPDVEGFRPVPTGYIALKTNYGADVSVKSSDGAG